MCSRFTTVEQVYCFANIPGRFIAASKFCGGGSDGDDQGFWRMAKRKSEDVEKPALKPPWTRNSRVCCFGILRGEETLVISLIM